jgi:hypothetical protein
MEVDETFCSSNGVSSDRGISVVEKFTGFVGSIGPIVFYCVATFVIRSVCFGFRRHNVSEKVLKDAG